MHPISPNDKVLGSKFVCFFYRCQSQHMLLRCWTSECVCFGYIEAVLFGANVTVALLLPIKNYDFPPIQFRPLFVVVIFSFSFFSKTISCVSFWCTCTCACAIRLIECVERTKKWTAAWQHQKGDSPTYFVPVRIEPYLKLLAMQCCSHLFCLW